MNDSNRITDGESPVLNDMGQPADVANAIAALEWIAKHSSEAMRAPEASALLAEIERLRAQVEVAMEGYREAVSKARWQAVTNRELNQLGEELRAAKESLTACGVDLAAEVQARETLKQHIHELSKYARHSETCFVFDRNPNLRSCTCGYAKLMNKGIAR